MRAEGGLDAGVLGRLEERVGLGQEIDGLVELGVNGGVGHARVEGAREGEARGGDEGGSVQLLHGILREKRGRVSGLRCAEQKPPRVDHQVRAQLNWKDPGPTEGRREVRAWSGFFSVSNR